VANSNVNTVSVLLGGRGGTFGAATNFTVGPSPLKVAVGQFNNDTDPDLAVANSSNQVSILQGSTGGTFTGLTDFDVQTSPTALAVGDFNADTEPDLAVGDSNGNGGSVSILTGLRPTDIAITKTDAPDPVVVGDVLTYTLTVQNTGAVSASSVSVSDTLGNAGYVSASASQGSCTESSGTVTCNLGTMAASASATVTIKVRPKQTGTLSNTATAVYAEDPDPSDNSDTEATQVNPPPAPPAGGCIDYPDFSPPSGLNLMTDARVDGNVLQLTDNSASRKGRAWFGTRVNVAGGFSSDFVFRMGDGEGSEGDGPGAEGLTFTIQNSSNTATGTSPFALGYQGITNSLAVEFDTFNNGASAGDTDGNHVAVHSRGTAANGPGTSSDSRMGIANVPFLMNDGFEHRGRVTYDPTGSGTLSVYVDDTTTPLLNVTVDLDTKLSLDGGTNAWVGFTGSTTSTDWEKHELLDWDFCQMSPANGAIVVVKEAIPDDAQNFTFTAGGGLSPTSFQLDDDSDGTLSNMQVFPNVAPGSGYTVSETVPGNWYQGAATCDNGSEPTDINVGAGDIVTCRFTNSRLYARPGSATPLRVPLVHAYQQCTSNNSTHASPLNLPSCTPAVTQSSTLRTGTGGLGAGAVKFSVISGNAGTPEDEADIALTANLSDVRKPDNTDYVGPVIVSALYRATDQSNDVDSAAAGTVIDYELAAPMNCTATAGSGGSNCTLSTTVDTMLPDAVLETRRAILSINNVFVRDAGPNTTIAPNEDPYGLGCPPVCGDGDEQLFMRQGIFAP
jgi:uncharacterized repeat protein (TIGR01451 family)